MADSFNYISLCSLFFIKKNKKTKKKTHCLIDYDVRVELVVQLQKTESDYRDIPGQNSNVS